MKEAEVKTNDSLKQTRRPRRKHKRRRKKDLSYCTDHGLLCFDSETTNHGEILELSVFGYNGEEVYHKYYRPRAKHWPTEIHHITPEKVAECKRFYASKNAVENLFNSTRYLLGCAVSNDLHTLQRYGIKLHENHRVFDIQNWHWLLNDASGRVEKHQTGLSTIADFYGLTFGKENAHSATADARITLECFNCLKTDFINKYCPDIDPDNLEEINRCFNVAYAEAMQVYRMKNSAGFINVVKRPQGYSFKYTRFIPTNIENLLLSVEVADRHKADHDMRRHFARKQIKGFTGIYNLVDKDFEYIKKYRNVLDIETFKAREEAERKNKEQAAERVFKTIAGRKTNVLKEKEKQQSEQKSASTSRRRKWRGSKESTLRAGTLAMRKARNLKKSDA